MSRIKRQDGQTTVLRNKQTGEQITLKNMSRFQADTEITASEQWEVFPGEKAPKEPPAPAATTQITKPAATVSATDKPVIETK